MRSKVGQTLSYHHESPISSLIVVVTVVVSSFALLVGAQLIDATNEYLAPNGPQQQQPQPQQQSQLQNIIQAQRQFGPLSNLMQSVASNLTQQPQSQIGQQQQQRMYNVLETLSNVGKAIQQQISSAASNQLQIVTSQGNSNNGGAELATNKKNEYQSIVVTDQGSSLENSSSPIVTTTSLSSSSLPSSSQQQQQQQPFINANQQNNYREQGELLRQEIVRRTSQLQQVVASSMDLMKNNGDLIMRRLLEQMNSRLDQAKTKADRIINEPATNEMAVKALSAINLGLNNLNNIITNIVTRLDSAAKENGGVNTAQRVGQSGAPVASNTSPQQLLQVPPLLDTTKFRQNLQQIGQQFQSAFNASQLHQQLMRQRQFLLNPNVNLSPTQQQQQQQLAAANNKINLDFVASSQKQN